MGNFTEVEKQEMRDALELSFTANDGDDRKIIVLIYDDNQLQAVSKGFDANALVVGMHKITNHLLQEHLNVKP